MLVVRVIRQTKPMCENKPVQEATPCNHYNGTCLIKVVIVKALSRHDNSLVFDLECILKNVFTSYIHVHIAMDMHNYDKTPIAIYWEF